MTVQQLINATLEDLNVIPGGGTPATEESASALRDLNDLLSSLNAQGLPIPEETKATIALTGAASYALSTRPIKLTAASVVFTGAMSLPVQVVDAAGWAAFQDKPTTADFAKVAFYQEGFPLGTIHLAPVPKTGGTLEVICRSAIGGGAITVRHTVTLDGAAFYTIGAGGDFDVNMPVEILSASMLSTGIVSQEAKIVTSAVWARYPDKGASGKFADILYYNGSLSTPTIFLAPKPVTGSSLELLSLSPLVEFGGLGETIDLPDGYQRALRKLLAVELAAQYPVDPVIYARLEKQAGDALTSIQGLNQAVLGPLTPAASPAPPPAPQVAA